MTYFREAAACSFSCGWAGTPTLLLPSPQGAPRLAVLVPRASWMWMGEPGIALALRQPDHVAAAGEAGRWVGLRVACLSVSFSLFLCAQPRSLILPRGGTHMWLFSPSMLSPPPSSCSPPPGDALCWGDSHKACLGRWAALTAKPVTPGSGGWRGPGSRSLSCQPFGLSPGLPQGGGRVHSWGGVSPRG